MLVDDAGSVVGIGEIKNGRETRFFRIFVSRVEFRMQTVV